jgi:hypothetical protein
VPAIGTPAAVTLPEVRFDSWFADAPDADPLAFVPWQEIATFQAVAQTTAGWTEACKAAAAAAGNERSSKPLIAAIACSDDPSVTTVQRFALLVLGARAHTALWMRGVPGFNTAGIQARLAQVGAACNADVAARDAAAGTPFATACELAADDSYQSGDGAATFAALGKAYETLAQEIARRDPTVDAEAHFFESAPATP